MTSDYGQINEASLAEVQSWLGVERIERGWNRTATADAIWHFAQGVGDDNPLWWDREYAARTRWGGLTAPPLFASTCSNAGSAPGQTGLYPAEAWFPGTAPIWVSDRWVFHRPIRVDETVTATARLSSVELREGRDGQPMATHVDHTTYTSDDGTLLADCFKTLNRYERRGDRSVGQPDTARYRYSDDEISRIEEHYSTEAQNRRGSNTRYGDDVAIDQPLTTVAKGPLTITGLVGFLMGWGSPMCSTNRMVYDYLLRHPGARLRDPNTNVPDTLEGAHWEPALATATGMADGYDFGLQRVCWIGHLLTDWCGDDGQVADLEVRLRRPNLLGDITWITGAVTAIEPVGDTTSRVTCSVSGTNQHDEVTVIGTAHVLLPRKT